MGNETQNKTNIETKIILNSILRGVLAMLILLAVYFLILTQISGWNFASGQFSAFWYFIVSLAFGFGVQVGLYSYLKNVIHHQQGSGKVLAISGTTSTAAMISCCSHYLINLLPILGISGLIVLIAQYQLEIFWFGLVFNLAGIGYMANRVIKFHQKN